MPKLPNAVVLLLAASPAFTQVAAPEEPGWTPDPAMIEKLEAGLKVIGLPGLTLTAGQLAQYDRYYTGVTVNGRRLINGVLLVPPNHEANPRTGIHITEAQFMPRLRGGGCYNITVRYYVDQNSGTGYCDLPEASAPASELPHWTPDAQLAARMEVRMRDYLEKAYPGIAPLDDYSRYYWGVTIDGNPVVHGNVLRLGASAFAVNPLFAPGVHLASNWDNGPSLRDGGCSNIRITYDVKTARFSELGCDGIVQLLQPEVPLP